MMPFLVQAMVVVHNPLPLIINRFFFPGIIITILVTGIHLLTRSEFALALIAISI